MKKIIIALVFLATSVAVIAQPPSDKAEKRKEAKERIEASKVAFITSYLNLSTEEAENFWPLYNEYRAELKALRPEGRRRIKLETLSDAEASTRLDEYIVEEQKKSEIKSIYMQKFRKVISDRKVLMLNKAEGEFKKQMVRRYADRRGGGKSKSAPKPKPKP